MRALAEFVMRGRAQAIGVACIPWIGSAAVGLVVLRKGGVDAVVVLGWGLLATFAMMLVGGNIALMLALLATAAGAVILRWTGSWPLALATIAALGVVFASSLNVFGDAYIAQVMEQRNEALKEVQAPPWVAQLAGSDLNAVQVAGAFGSGSVMLGVAFLALARHWQAQLYNPGGFGREFRQLRLPPQVALPLVAAGIGLVLMGPGYEGWVGMVAMPLLIAGLGLVHGMVALKGWGAGPLVGFYVALVLLRQPVILTLILLALIDGWLDFRARHGANDR